MLQVCTCTKAGHGNLIQEDSCPVHGIYPATVTTTQGVELPDRRFVVKIEIGGDTADDIESALRQLHFDWSRGSRGCVSGGCSSSWTVSVRENPEMTHEKYVAALNDYLAQEKKESR